MAGGVIVGILRERHAIRITSSSATASRCFLPPSRPRASSRSGSAVAYTVRKDGRKIADNIWRSS
jgi:hypothetical protein